MAKRKTPEELFEKLARMVKRGFDDTATKSDLTAFRHEMDGKFREVDGKFRVVTDSLELLQRDMRDVKTILGPSARGVVEHEERIKNLERRVGRVEQKVGFGR